MSASLETNIPQPRVRPLVGNAPDIDSETPIQSMVELARELGPIYRLSFGKGSMLVLSSLELASDACDETRFDKKVSGGLSYLRDFVADGLFTAHTNEPNWAKAHRILMPAFGPASMRNYFEDMLDIADQMLTKWERLGPEASIDVADNMTRLTLDTIALSGFGYRFNSFYQNEMHPLIEAMVRALSEAGGRARRLPIQTTLMLRTQRQYEADGRFMHAVTEELIAKRRKMPEDEAPRDLLGLMLNAKDPVTGEHLDDTNIRYQLLTFLIAGHETTSGLLSFAIHLLLKHPEVLRKAQAEADRVLGADTPRFEQVAQLGYFDQILRETLRLWPTAPGFTVAPKHDTLLAGRYPVKKRNVLLVLLPALHRDPAVWKEPERFDPDRFAPDMRDKIPPHAWKPFGNGQRGCIGRAFAMQEATLVLAMLLQRFEIWEPARYELVVKEALTLKPDGLRIRARVRQPVARGFSTKPAPRPSAPASVPEASSAHGTPLLLLYGSNSGASEAFARRIASDGQARGYAANVAPLDDYTGRLPKEGAAIIVTASYNGQSPDNARKFATWLAGVPDASLVGVRYALFGCGNRDWTTTYQSVPKEIAGHLDRAGAQALVARGEGDARGDFFGDFEQWYGPLWERLGAGRALEAPHRVRVAARSDLRRRRLSRRAARKSPAPGRARRAPARDTTGRGRDPALEPRRHGRFPADRPSRLHPGVAGTPCRALGPGNTKGRRAIGGKGAGQSAAGGPERARVGPRALSGGSPQEARERARPARRLSVMRAELGRISRAASRHAGASILDFLLSAREPFPLHGDGGDRQGAGLVGPRGVSRDVLQLPRAPGRRGSGADRHPHAQCSVSSSGAQQHARRHDLRRDRTGAVSRVPAGASLAPRPRRAGGSSAAVLRLRPPRRRLALSRGARAMGAGGRRHAVSGVLPQARWRGDVRAASPMEGPRKGPRAVPAGRDLLPVRGGSIHGAGGPRDAGKNLSGDGRLHGRRGVELAARDGTQGPLRAGRLRLKMGAGLLVWLPRCGYR